MGREVKTVRYCRLCGKAVYRGERYSWERGGYERQDEDGEYDGGCGECRTCGEVFCGECGKFEGGVCARCREKEKEPPA
jgi:hypothetical protein